MKKRISITIEEETLSEIDKKRGLVNRSKFLEEMLKTIKMPIIAPAQSAKTETSAATPSNSLEVA